jgi:cytochrome c2
LGTGFRLIATLFWVVLLYGGAALAAGQACLNCHAEHYQERGNCVDCHLGRGDTQRKDIAHDRMLEGRYAAFTLPDSPVVERGKHLLEKTACRRCHIAGNRGNRYAANLDLSPQSSSGEEIFNAIREPALFMPDFHFSDPQIVELVNVIYANSRKAAQPETEVPVLIHFEDTQPGERSVFEKECGSCHRMLTKHKGGLGGGHLGPNLSGLLTEFYPKTYPEEKPWTVQGLGDWLKNPRTLRKNARMAPVVLKDEKWLRLQLDFYDGEPAESPTCQDSCSL